MHKGWHVDMEAFRKGFAAADDSIQRAELYCESEAYLRSMNPVVLTTYAMAMVVYLSLLHPGFSLRMNVRIASDVGLGITLQGIGLSVYGLAFC